MGSRSCDGSISLIIASPQHVINRAAAAGAFAAEGEGDERHRQPITFDHTVAFTWLGRSSWLTARKRGLQVPRCRCAALSRSALQFGIGWVLGFCAAARSSTRARRRRGPPHSHRRRTSSALQQSQWYGARRDMRPFRNGPHLGNRTEVRVDA